MGTTNEVLDGSLSEPAYEVFKDPNIIKYLGRELKNIGLDEPFTATWKPGNIILTLVDNSYLSLDLGKDYNKVNGGIQLTKSGQESLKLQYDIILEKRNNLPKLNKVKLVELANEINQKTA